MTIKKTHDKKRSTRQLLAATITVIALALLASFFAVSQASGALARATAETSEIPPAPLGWSVADSSAELGVDDGAIDCPQGTIEHDGQCIEFVPPSGDCPEGTIEHDGQCLEFEVPDCELGYKLVGIECVELAIEVSPEPTPALQVAPAPTPGDDCPQGTIYHDGQCIEFVPPTNDCPEGTIEHDGQCLEFEVPECELGYKLVGIECVELAIEVAPAQPPAPARPVAPAPAPGDDCPQGTIYHDGQCIEFVPPTNDCPEGTIEHDGQCLEFEVPECGFGFKLVGLECVELAIEVAPAQPPAPARPVAPAPAPGDDCPQGTIYHDGQCIEFVPPSGDCPQGTIEHDGQCIEFEVPDCDFGYKLVGNECVKLTIEVSPAQPPARRVGR